MAEQMLKLETNIARAQAMLLRAHIAGDRPDDVYRDLLTLLEQSGSDMDAVVRYIGEAIGSVPDAGRWLGVMQRLADRLPDRPEVHLARSFVAHRAGQFGQADASLNRALELRPGWKKQQSSGCPGGTMQESRKPSRHLLKNLLPPIRTEVVFSWDLPVCWFNGRITTGRSSSFST